MDLISWCYGFVCVLTIFFLTHQLLAYNKETNKLIKELDIKYNKTKYRAKRISNTSDWYVLKYAKVGVFGIETWHTIPILKRPNTSDYGEYKWQFKGTTWTIKKFVKEWSNIDDYLKKVEDLQKEIDEKEIKDKKYWKNKLNKEHPETLNF